MNVFWRRIWPKCSDSLYLCLLTHCLRYVYAEAEAAYLQGHGIARQRQAIVNGLRESVLNFEDGVKAVSPQEVNPELIGEVDGVTDGPWECC